MKRFVLKMLPILLVPLCGAALAQIGDSKELSPRKVTLVVFVDNSGSMETYKPRVRELVGALTEALKKPTAWT